MFDAPLRKVTLLTGLLLWNSLSDFSLHSFDFGNLVNLYISPFVLDPKTELDRKTTSKQEKVREQQTRSGFAVASGIPMKG